MLFTKKQAAGMWCPWAFRPIECQLQVREGEDPVPFVVATNRGAKGEPQCPCIADQCPMWEWSDNAAHGESRRGYCARKTKPGAVINAQQQGGMRIPDLKRN